MKITSLQVAPIYTNCYILCDEEEKVCAVVDPGGSPDRVAETIAETGCTPVCILLTHGHFDHVSGVAALLKKYPDIPVYLNNRDIYPEGDHQIRNLFPLSGVKTENYDEGDTVSVGNLKIHVLATPGHTEGSVTLKCENALFCGDTLFAGSCGRSDFEGGDAQKMLSSLQKLGNLEGDFQIYPGHMGTTTLNTERASNPCLQSALKG